MRSSVALFVVSLVVLAGCGSSPSSQAPPDTDTPSEIPTISPTSGAPTIDATTIPGIRTNGVNVTRLTATHDAALNRTAYTLNVSVRRGDTRQQIFVATEGPVPTHLRRESGNRVRAEYFTGNRFYRRDVVGGDISYERGPFVGNPAFSGASILREYMSNAQYEPTGTTIHNGDPVVVLKADQDGLDPDAFGDATVDSFASQARVDADGVIRSFSFLAQGTTADGRQFIVRLELRVTDIGDTVVGTPDWVAKAREATSGNSTATAT